MGTISQVHTYPNGLTIGFDSEANDWVPVDKQAFEGSTLGNIARGAGRSVEGIGQGIKELVGNQNDAARIQAEGEALARRQQAASNAAPVAETVGGAVPDVAAGVGLGLATSGLGLPAMVGAEAGLGAVLGGIRPGTVEERLQGAVVSAGLTVLGLGVGAALGPIAVKGIGGAVTAFRGLEGRMLGKINQAVETAGGQLRQADEAAAAVRQPGSVGAAAAPVDEAMAQESAALAATERAGGNIDTLGAGARRETAEALGYRSPLGAGTREGSAARKVAAVRQAGIGDIFEQQVMHDNQRLISTKVADALGLPNPEQYTSIYPDMHLADAEQASKTLFEAVETNMPSIGVDELGKAYSEISQKSGLAQKSLGQKIVNDMVEKARQRGGVLDGEEIMKDRSALSEEMSRLYRDNQVASGDAVKDAIAKLDRTIEQTLKAQKRTDVSQMWEKARSQWQILSMVKRPGVLGRTGEIRPNALMRQMEKDKDSAGFGRDGPVRGSKARQVWDIARVAAEDETHVPLTGYRGLIAEQLKKGAVGKAALGAGGIYGAGHGLGIWD